MPCSTCCVGCLQSGPRRASEDRLLPLDGLLSAGVILLLSKRDGGMLTTCAHTHAEDGWHPLRTPLERDQLEIAPQDIDERDHELLPGLLYLDEHGFLRITYRVRNDDPAMLVFRVYIIHRGHPDLAETMDSGIPAQARRHLVMVLRRLVQDKEYWEGRITTPLRQPNTVCCPSRYFCILADANHCHQDRRTLPEVYSKQPSPRPPEDILGFFRAADVSAKIGLQSSLLRYQQETNTVAAMANLEM